MDKKLVEQIREGMKSKNTEELLTIWEENDRETWSNEAFEAIKQLLLERGEILPPQKEFKKRETIEEQMSRPNKVSWAVTLLYVSLGIYVVSHIIMGLLLLLTHGDFGVAVSQSFPFVVWAKIIIWFLIYWKIGEGRNWARITFLVLFIINIPLVVALLPECLAADSIFGLLSIGEIVVHVGMQVIALVFLFQKPSSEWFRRMSSHMRSKAE